MNSDKKRLIHDLMNDGGEETRRTETLLAGGRVLRRRRHVRQATRALSVLGLAALATLWVQQWTSHKSTVLVESPKPSPSTPAPAEIQKLTDDELLALFPDVPVGLATLSDGTKKLIFPRTEDEARFVKHL